MGLSLHLTVHGKAQPDMTQIRPDIIYIRPDMYLSPLVLDSKMKERDGYMKCPHGVPLWYVSEALIS